MGVAISRDTFSPAGVVQVSSKSASRSSVCRPGLWSGSESVAFSSGIVSVYGTFAPCTQAPPGVVTSWLCAGRFGGVL